MIPPAKVTLRLNDLHGSQAGAEAEETAAEPAVGPADCCRMLAGRLGCCRAYEGQCQPDLVGGSPVART